MLSRCLASFSYRRNDCTGNSADENGLEFHFKGGEALQAGRPCVPVTVYVRCTGASVNRTIFHATGLPSKAHYS